MTLPKGLIDAAKAGHLVPFVGAGVSLSVTGPGGARLFPSWWGLLEQLGEALEAEGRPQAALVKAYMGQPVPDLLEAARHARVGFGAAWYDRLVSVFDPPDHDPASLALPQAIWRLSPLVITTNYDRVLQWASPSRATRTVGVNSPRLATFLRGVDRPTVWHVHGHVDAPDEIILTPDGYTRLYPETAGVEAEHAAALQTLRAVLTSRTLLFVGFSLEDAAFIKQVEWVRDTFQGAGGPHYVLVREADAASMAAKLQGIDVRPVTFSDFGPPLVATVAAIADAMDAAVAPPPEPAPVTPVPVTPVAPPAVPTVLQIAARLPMGLLGAPGQRALLFSRFPPGYVAHIPRGQSPAGQLQLDLHHVATQPVLGLDGPPLAVWLENAAQILAMAAHPEAPQFHAWAAAVRQAAT